MCLRELFCLCEPPVERELSHPSRHPQVACVSSYRTNGELKSLSSLRKRTSGSPQEKAPEVGSSYGGYGSSYTPIAIRADNGRCRDEAEAGECKSGVLYEY